MFSEVGGHDLPPDCEMGPALLVPGNWVGPTPGPTAHACSEGRGYASVLRQVSGWNLSQFDKAISAPPSPTCATGPTWDRMLLAVATAQHWLAPHDTPV